MFRNIFEGISGINTLPIVALIVFFVIFVLVIIYILTMNKEQVDYMSRIPLDSSNEIKNEINPEGEINGKS
jgi:cbb3-type cytochrome oxidase subunit 3